MFRRPQGVKFPRAREIEIATASLLALAPVVERHQSWHKALTSGDIGGDPETLRIVRQLCPKAYGGEADSETIWQDWERVLIDAADQRGQVYSRPATLVARLGPMISSVGPNENP
jgi:hypothetical protein